MKSPASFSRGAGWPQRPFKLEACLLRQLRSTSEFDLLTWIVGIIDTQSHRFHGQALQR